MHEVGEEAGGGGAGVVGVHVAVVVGGEGVAWFPSGSLVPSTTNVTPFHDARSATDPTPPPVAGEYHLSSKRV